MITNLAETITVVLALSVAAERLVDIIKNIIPFLRKEQVTVGTEGFRNISLQVLAVAAGIGTALLAKKQDLLPSTMQENWLWLGLLASCGSSFWTSVLGYVNNVKELKKTEAIGAKVRTAAEVAAIAARPALLPAAPVARRALALAHIPKPDADSLAKAQEARTNLERLIAVANTTL